MGTTGAKLKIEHLWLIGQLFPRLDQFSQYYQSGRTINFIKILVCPDQKWPDRNSIDRTCAGKMKIDCGPVLPQGASVNDATDAKLCSLQYTSVNRAANITQWFGPDALLAKVDIRAAYHLIPVHPNDQLLLGLWLCWKGRGRFRGGGARGAHAPLFSHMQGGFTYSSQYTVLKFPDHNCLYNIPSMISWVGSTSACGVVVH